jgi:aminoglycoside 2'-N-acetyltransferase I
MTRLRVLADADVPARTLAGIRRFLVAAFEGDFTDEDWEHTRGGWRVVAHEGSSAVSHAAVVPRRIIVADRAFRTGYLEGVATRPERQRRGLGSEVIARATELVRERFELGALSTGVPALYERFGWERWRGPSFVLDGAERIRTPGEDAGLMVLRCGPSAGIELTGPITCERRPGDDW